MSTLRKLLSTPVHGFSHTPFWFWNGDLDPAVMRQQMEMMADQKIKGAMPHPRFGMDRRAYLEEPYWKAFDATVAAAEQLGSSVLLYDEYNWPSGCAGGRVTAGRRDLLPHGLDYIARTATGPGLVTLSDFAAGEPIGGSVDLLVNAFIVPADCPLLDAGLNQPDHETTLSVQPWGTVSADKQSICGELPPGEHRILVFFQATGGNPSPLNPGSGAFVDFLNPEVGQRFIKFTHEEYRKRYGHHFGKLIPAIFTDEPSTLSGGPFPWTWDFAAEFAKRRGFDILEKLPALCDERYPGGYAIRAAYWQTVADLFEERFIGQVSDWCKANNIALTGHIFDEYLDGWTCATHLMNWLRRFDWPGIDALGKHSMAEGCKIAASVAHLENKPHFLCEALGLADGWNATLGMAKRGYQFLGVMGVDVFVPHGFHQTIENPRVECPPSWFFQNPYWVYYSQMSDLTARLAHFNQSGRHVAPVAVFYPIESIWADGTGGRGQNCHPWQAKARGNAHAKQTTMFFNEAIGPISAGPFDCDVVDTRYLLEAKIDTTTGEFLIAQERFSCLVMPCVRTIPLILLEKLEQFALAGGLIIFTGQFPERCYPASEINPLEFFKTLSLKAKRGTQSAIRRSDTMPELVTLLEQEVSPVIAFQDERPQGVLVMARQSATATQWLIVNDLETPRTFSVTLPTRLLPPQQNETKPTIWACNMETGLSTQCAAKETPTGLLVTLSLGHTDAVVVIAESTLSPAGASQPTAQPTSPSNVLSIPHWTFQVVPMDYSGQKAMELKSVLCDLPAWKMQPRGWAKYEGWTQSRFDDSSWQTVTAFRQEAQSQSDCVLLRCPLPPGARAIKLPIPVTGEYALHVNGHLVEERLGMPAAEGLLSIVPFIQGLNNTVAIEVASESDLAGLSAPLQVLCGPLELAAIKPWSELGLAWYTGRAAYHTRIELPATPTTALLDLGQVEHYVEVWVNQKLAGIRLWHPYSLDIASLLHKGTNEICLIVSNSVANRFIWDKWSDARTGTSWGVPPRAEPSGLLSEPRLLWQ